MSERATLSAREAAAYLGISRVKMNWLIRQRMIAVTEIPGVQWPKFTKQALDAFLAAHTSGPFGPFAGPNELKQSSEVFIRLAQIEPGQKFNGLDEVLRGPRDTAK